MGFYIETPVPLAKAAYLIKYEGAHAVDEGQVPELRDVPEDMSLVCVVQNGPFDAAAIAYDEGERECFLHPDGREKDWLMLDRERALALCGRPDDLREVYAAAAKEQSP